MTPDRTLEPEPPLSEAERSARERVRRLPRAAADPDFRARLAADFASGRIAQGPARGGVFRLPWHHREMTRWALAAAAAAALIVTAIALNEGPAWRVTSRHGGGIASVDGRGVELGSSEFEHLLKPGAHLALPSDADVALAAGDQMMVALDPGSEVTLPGAPGRWWGRRIEGRVDSGIMRVSLGPMFHGSVLALRTRDAQLRVVGTTFAVICEPTGTCVCVLEGVVDVGPIGGTMSEIPGGMRGYVFANGAPMDREGMRPDERIRLTELRRRRMASAGMGR